MLICIAGPVAGFLVGDDMEWADQRFLNARHSLAKAGGY
jgi:hypothetical protein